MFCGVDAIGESNPTPGDSTQPDQVYRPSANNKDEVFKEYMKAEQAKQKEATKDFLMQKANENYANWQEQQKVKGVKD